MLQRFVLKRMKIPQSLSWRQLATATTSNTCPIVIVGAGPSGLFLSRLLDSYGVSSIVLEASPSPTRHPQAHFLNTRTMEIMRHSLPSFYSSVRKAMLPVDEWKTFSFGYDMRNTMAQVVHPVDVPLQEDLDANGILLPTNKDIAAFQTTEPLSVCSVGHLAQHTFCRLLNETNAPLATVHYGMRVTHVKFEGGQHQVLTENGTTFAAPIVVAADGFHSTCRKLWNIDMNGQEGIQHLINVHVRVSERASNNIPPAMLYSVWNENLVAMIVRHSPDEYVFQIPYFPPYQTMQQNFTPHKVEEMVKSAFGTLVGITIESIRPWSMSSLVAQRYVSNNGGVLIGDAAHVFPPAGGFGMNTGLQDAHNLAWRLALWGQSKESLQLLLSQYESERRPVAQRNAALSVRNYNRVLELSKACYLNEQHPTFLVGLLDKMTLLPLATRQNTFQRLLETAMFPLTALQNSSNLYAQHVTANVRNILKRGGGLPLLFPSFELGFGYNDDDKNTKDSTTQDSMGYAPQLREGYLVPHVELKVINYCEDRHANLQVIQNDGSNCRVCISSSDLPSQLRLDSPCFVELVLNASFESMETVQNALSMARAESNVHIASVQVINASTRHEPDDVATFDLIVQDDASRLATMTKTSDPVIVLIRPDGHVARVLAVQDKNAVQVGMAIVESIDESLGVLKG